MTNVVRFEIDRSNRLSVIASELHELDEKEASTWDELVTNIWDKAVRLREARKACGDDDTAFGEWLRANDFHSGKGDRNYRRDLIEIAGFPMAEEWMRTSRPGTAVSTIAERVRNMKSTCHNTVTGAEEKIETNETVDIAPETLLNDEATENNLAEKAVIEHRSYKSMPRIVKLIGKEHGDIIYSFIRRNNSQCLKLLCDIAEKNKAGVSAVRNAAREMASGKYGPGHDTCVNSISPRMFFPALPPRFASNHSCDKATSSGLQSLLDKMPKIAEMVSSVDGENFTDEFCHRWWNENVMRVNKPVVETEQLKAAIDHVAATRAAFAAAGVIMEEIEETSEFADHKVADRYTPLEDADIIVCGQVIYTAGSEPADIYQRLWSTYRLWKMWEGNFKRGEPRVSERGFEYRRLSAFFDGIDGPSGRMLWKIGHAMAENPDRILECSASRERGAYK